MFSNLIFCVPLLWYTPIIYNFCTLRIFHTTWLHFIINWAEGINAEIKHFPQLLNLHHSDIHWCSMFNEMHQTAGKVSSKLPPSRKHKIGNYILFFSSLFAYNTQCNIVNIICAKQTCCKTHLKTWVAAWEELYIKHILSLSRMYWMKSRLTFIIW